METVLIQVEKIDTEASNRPKVFGSESVVKNTSKLDRLKVVSGDLLDLWLFEGSRGLKYI